jgi:O-antigen ligase
VIRAGVLTAARLALLAGPVALAFFTGGYFPEAQAWAGLAVWALVALSLVLSAGRRPGGRAFWLAAGGLALLAGWTLLSITWAPIAGNAYHAGQLVMVYLGALLAAMLLLGGSGIRRWVEPALAAGAVIVIGYGLSGRLLPGALHFAHSLSALGRLEQPLTYWNAMGELAALGFVLAAGVAGDRTRPGWLRLAAAAAVAPLGMGLYVSFSRGALFACAAGLIALVVIVRRRELLWAVVRAICFGGLAAVAAAPFRSVTALTGSVSTQERDGAIVLGLLVLITVAAGLAQYVFERREAGGELRLPRRSPLIATAVIVAGLGLAIVVGAHETSGRAAPRLSGGAARLASLRSDRYDYWSVALRAFGTEPFHGVGAGGWSVYWLRWRSIPEGAQDAHSLELQTLAELGVVGLALLLVFLTGVALGAARALRTAAPPAAAVAALITYLVHSPLDWDWQMPAVTLIAVVLAGKVLALAAETYSSSAIRGASRRKIQTASTHTAA